MTADYNTQREPIILKEYGRNVQKIVDHIATIEDEAKKLELAKVLIEMMKQLNPAIRENQDYVDRLWNHIYIISDFKLDLEGAPVAKPETSIFDCKPEQVPYSENRIKFLHYGKNIERLVDEAKAEQEPAARKDKTVYVARLMKKFYMTWNKENVDDQLIITQMERLSNNELTLDAKETTEQNLLYVNPKDLIQKAPVNVTKNNNGRNNNNRGRSTNSSSNNNKNRRR